MKTVLLLMLLGQPFVPLFAEIGELNVDAGPAATGVSAPKDESTLWLKIGTRVTAVLMDPQGHQTGVDPKTFQVIKEIPGSECDVDFIPSPYDEHAEAHERITLIPARKGTYKLMLQGLQTGPFDIAANSLSKEGSSQPSKDLEGVISEGEEKIVKLTFDPAPNALISMIEVSHPK